jgi:neutral/alkaline ceramidase-like enzyme
MKLLSIIKMLLIVLFLEGCLGPTPPMPQPPRPTAGYWFDTFRARRSRMKEPEFIAGSARVKLTPKKRGIQIAGHGHFRKHSKGVLDDIYARVLYLDSGHQAVVLVSLDFIGLMNPRVERIRARVSHEHPEQIIIASTHNHSGPDTEGLWGPALFGLLPIRSGIDRQYLDWVERRVARAILRAIATARPARLYLGRTLAPEGLAKNMREPKDVPREMTILRVAAKDGFTIGTIVNYANHAEALQDTNRYMSADFPGALCREVDLALGGVTLFFSGPAGGMLEPNNEPEDPEPERIAFKDRLGGALAEKVILQAVGGMQEIGQPTIRLFNHRFELPINAEGLVALAMKLNLLEPRPIKDNHLTTEASLLDLGQLQLITIPGEITPEVGRMISDELSAPYKMIVTLGSDHLAYMISDRQWQDPRFFYEREMSLGQKTTGLVLTAVKQLADKAE